ncbi:alkyldihydroxyacetonephosphate synthase, peroxisomal-like [Amphibalanus amphitrite]|uniref:alkyldihydroxyacetonephosphate synthase, peroxisomal-like n=1 Tax=Amphibalanus amphitrite TaxID=1232801 RepID=UPI001C920CBB|nr:alkyldihydroxyacetonephosphate synthase, peroxisomal-like [Amphibalanus amphitrite]XP_043230933.1 alkyldihydroxyacetonephosphate synthase, peroxisomal-like [Amphibalanus amphitrite]XP_043230934.1 alkyldihydroxyacetonephosphate synthase, peroxisomal-like [Amphibalanus amphitrite]
MEQMSVPKNKSFLPKRRQELLKWNGWGYKDSKFVKKSNGEFGFLGNRYPIGGGEELPLFRQWVQTELGIDTSRLEEAVPEPAERDYPPPNVQPEFLAALTEAGLSHSVAGDDRLWRSHGHTMHEIFALRRGELPPLVDLVVWPECHSDVERLVRLAAEHGVALIPYGGGTSVTGALLRPDAERRTVASVDTSQMARVLSISAANLTARCEAGIIGQDLERVLQAQGYTCGHEPDSYEFSSLGGWVATRASGMKKNTYGNMEDLLVHVRLVTPRGVLERGNEAPRISAGPDLHQLVLGSEGTLGIITEVTVKIRPVPPVRRHGGLMFPDFVSGVRFMREVAAQRRQPASVRLMDNEQFKFGQALKTPSGSFGWIKTGLQKAYITRWKGFDLNKVCIVTLMFEGTEEEVSAHEARLLQLATAHGGFSIGEENGKRGYMLTFVIAYIRDLGFEFQMLSESFETSMPWDRCLTVCDSVKRRVRQECSDRGVSDVFITCRVTQTYDAGAVVYFYFAFCYKNVADPVQVYEDVEAAARDEIIRCGGSISHHHGVGKIRQRWMRQTVSAPGLGVLRATKQYLDPDNVFACGNLYGQLPELPESKL